MERLSENQLNSLIRNSGNSDVDLTVHVDIDTKAIAYGMLCSLYAKGELTEFELERAVQKLDRLIEKSKRNQKPVSTSVDNKTTSYNTSEPRRRRSWF
ncbi:hypothetical protein [Neobacillus bataviensis]|uniref:hypothetical protein n=1 Tax=Neobacillus bataviensis TaxID=220685 RepID=UPI001CBDA218|nr:hypothetical protein [Neobacillus bataviensis]